MKVKASNKALIALGSNMGDRAANLQKAAAELARFMTVEKGSRVYESAPEGFADQQYFYNAAVLVYTDLEPQALLDRLKEIEKDMGRVPSFPNGPRLIDLDLIFFNNIVLENEALTVPHKKAHERCFVLRPAADIDPGYSHPVFKLTVSSLLQKCRGSCSAVEVNLLKNI